MGHDTGKARATGQTIGDVMTASPVSIESDQPAVQAAKAMEDANVGSLPVVEDGKLVGMVTDRDLVMRVMARGLDASKVTVSDCCSADPVFLRADETLDAALARMAKEKVRRLPVVEDGRRLVGIVAQADVSHAASPAETGQMVEEISTD